uniref:Uncharacterized protein TCIL3000_11_15650 n=1 Tax=Trypanosoma congolense (strain IL3000) TaxID=1068625 RepID=G0V332_TRYCI|nr:unnamed protein product [Trypanosoma congolense IL3000]
MKLLFWQTKDFFPSGRLTPKGIFTQKRCSSTRALYCRNANPAWDGKVSMYRLPLRRALWLIDEKGAHNTAPTDPLTRLEENIDAACAEQETAHPLQGAASRYAAYHCHHMLTSFRAERRGWTEKSSGSGGSLPMVDIVRVVEYMFFASVLLHLTALYEVANKYCESLIDVTLSSTIFLSKNVKVLLHKSSAADAEELQDVTHREGELGGDAWHSLHWAVVHYSKGVCHWGLLDHTDSLFDMQRTLSPFRILLLTLTKLLKNFYSSVHLPHREKQFLLYITSAEGSTHWLSGRVGEGVTKADGSTDRSNTDQMDTEKYDPHCFAQQRRLQLLPLLWTAVLGCRAASLGGGSRFALARHALLHVLPLFSKEAKANIEVILIAQALYISPVASLKANSIHLGTFLARAERYEVFHHSLGHWTAPYTELLRRWMCTRKKCEPLLEVRGVHKAYAAFRDIPLCALHLCGEKCDSVSDGKAFVHELLLLMLLQWSSLLNAMVTFHGESEEILASTRHVAQLVGYAKKFLHRGENGTELLIYAAEMVLYSFSLRVKILCSMKGIHLGEKDRANIAQFEEIILKALPCDADGILSDPAAHPHSYLLK